MNTDLNIKMLIDNNLGTGFIKKHMKLQSLMNSEKTTRGDKSFARMQSETAQVRLNKGFTPLLTTKEPNNSLSLEAPLNHPLKRTTFNYTKRREEQWQKNKSQALNELEIIQL